MKNKKKRLNILVLVLVVLLIAVVAWGVTRDKTPSSVEVSDGIEQLDLDTIYLEDSGVEVNFSEVLLSDHEESRKLIISTQEGTVSTELTDKLIKALNFKFLEKTQTVSYTGTGYFVVDLGEMKKSDIIEDKKNRTITIKIGHAYLEAIEIDPNKVIIDEVKEGLLARGDIKLTVSDYNEIEKDLRSRLEKKFNTVKNGQEADDLALKMVREVYEPIVKAIDRRYSVIVEFK